MYLIKEEDRPPTLLSEATAGPLDDLSNVLHPRSNGRQLLEGALGGSCDDERKGGLSRSGWPPQDRRGEAILLDQATEWPARADQVLLADDIVEGLGAETGCKRSPSAQVFLCGRAEQVPSASGHGVSWTSEALGSPDRSTAWAPPASGR
ncbi:unannotated protein [freshwater metagenome]|uniref:Unannotated protein n=1 Tax=freshwater metagenome TaxID=449393 RepID=A0A6J6SHU7_9ZZZZ